MKTSKVIVTAALILLTAVLIWYFIPQNNADDTRETPAAEYYQCDNVYNCNSITTEINLTGKTDMETAENILDYVYNNVNYNSAGTDAECFNSTASAILEDGSGKCSTMSILTVAMMRKYNLAARTVGGCASVPRTCDLTKEFNIANRPYRMPVITEVKIINNTASRAGGLHAWVEVYLNGRWQIADPTAGRIMTGSCVNYYTELYPTKIRDVCITENMEFARWCATV